MCTTSIKKSELKNSVEPTEPKPICWVSFCCYSLQGKSYTEDYKYFNLAAKTYEGLRNKIRSVHAQYLEDKDYIGTTELKGAFSPSMPHHLSFETAYIWGPKCHYDIYIRPIFKEEL